MRYRWLNLVAHLVVVKDTFSAPSKVYKKVDVKRKTNADHMIVVDESQKLFGRFPFLQYNSLPLMVPYFDYDPK